MRLKIIFVDDEVNVLNGLRRALRKKTEDWQIDFANSGAEALEKFQQQSFDVIVSDMMMPGMSGEELLACIQNQYPKTSRIVLSGQCDQSTAFRLVGSDHFYLAKPCPTDLLIETIENAALLSHPPLEDDVSAQEVKTALCEFVKLLLMRGIIHINSVPASIKRWLPETTLKAFAPVAGEYNEFISSTDFEKSTNWPDHSSAESTPDYGWDEYFNEKN